MHDSRGIEIVNFTISLALSAGTLMASGSSRYSVPPSAGLLLPLATQRIRRCAIARCMTQGTETTAVIEPRRRRAAGGGRPRPGATGGGARHRRLPELARPLGMQEAGLSSTGAAVASSSRSVSGSGFEHVDVFRQARRRHAAFSFDEVDASVDLLMENVFPVTVDDVLPVSVSNSSTPSSGDVPQTLSVAARRSGRKRLCRSLENVFPVPVSN